MQFALQKWELLILQSIRNTLWCKRMKHLSATGLPYALYAPQRLNTMVELKLHLFAYRSCRAQKRQLTPYLACPQLIRLGATEVPCKVRQALAPRGSSNRIVVVIWDLINHRWNHDSTSRQNSKQVFRSTISPIKMVSVPDDRLVLNISDIKNEASRKLPKAARGK